jgi:hypothetical protein
LERQAKLRSFHWNGTVVHNRSIGTRKVTTIADFDSSSKLINTERAAMAAPILPVFPKECRCDRSSNKRSFAAGSQDPPALCDEFKNEVGTIKAKQTAKQPGCVRPITSISTLQTTCSSNRTIIKVCPSFRLLCAGASALGGQKYAWFVVLL